MTVFEPRVFACGWDTNAIYTQNFTEKCTLQNKKKGRLSSFKFCKMARHNHAFPFFFRGTYAPLLQKMHNSDFISHASMCFFKRPTLITSIQAPGEGVSVLKIFSSVRAFDI